jgi:hypothetical protein
MSCEVLHATNDGDDLDPSHLRLLELAVNGALNDQGIEKFQKLYDEVKAGGYKKPWFHDVENLTIDNVGFVYWKGIEIEHYIHFYTPEAKRGAKELGVRCRHLESIGVPVNGKNVIWDWEKYQLQTAPQPIV